MLVTNEQYLLAPFVEPAIYESECRLMLLCVALPRLVERASSLYTSLALSGDKERTGASSGKSDRHNPAFLGRLRHAAFLLRASHVTSPGSSRRCVAGIFHR